MNCSSICLGFNSWIPGRSHTRMIMFSTHDDTCKTWWRCRSASVIHASHWNLYSVKILLRVNILSASLRRADFYACFGAQNHQEMENRIEGRKAPRRRSTDPPLHSIIHEASERARVRTSRSKARAASAERNREGRKLELRSLQLRDKAVHLIRFELQCLRSGHTNWPFFASVHASYWTKSTRGLDQIWKWSFCCCLSICFWLESTSANIHKKSKNYKTKVKLTYKRMEKTSSKGLHFE